MSNHVNSLITEIDVSNPPKRKIFVGHIGENGFRKIVFLVDSWKEEFPTGTPTLVFKRADGKTYPVDLNQNASGDPVFTPSSTETAFAGDCVIQLRWTQDGVLGKTCDLPASVESAIGSVGPLPDDDVRDYEEEISANTNARHTHSNKNILDGITAQKVSMWDEGGNVDKAAISANTNARHTHSNKNILDGITAQKVSMWDEGGNVDKAAIIANTNARHTHNNKNVLDGITAQKVSKWDEGGTVDSELSSASTNPVQNKVVKAALDQKANASDLSNKQDKLTAGQNITISGNTISADVDPTEIASNVTDWLDDNVDPVGSAVVVDSSLSIAGAAADAKATGTLIVDKGLTTAQYAALKSLLNAAVFDDSVLSSSDVSDAIDSLIGEKDIGKFGEFKTKQNKTVNIYSDSGETVLQSAAEGTLFMIPATASASGYTVKTRTTYKRTATVYVGYTTDDGLTIYNAVALNPNNTLPVRVEFSERVVIPANARLAAFATMTNYGSPSNSGYAGTYESIWYYKEVT